MPHARLLFLALLISLLGVRIAAAQEATPYPAGALALPAAPGPELCTLPPRGIDEYAAFVGQPVPAAPESVTITAGRPADPVTVDAITATMVAFAACINAGDYLRVGGAYTDAGFAEDNAANIDEGVLGFIASTPQPAPVDQRYAIYAIYAAQVLDDGRVAAIIQFGPDGTGGVNLLIFAEEGTRWLIDHWVDEPFLIRPADLGSASAEATPAT
jgi:hypothetical protein